MAVAALISDQRVRAEALVVCSLAIVRLAVWIAMTLTFVVCKTTMIAEQLSQVTNQQLSQVIKQQLSQISSLS